MLNIRKYILNVINETIATNATGVSNEQASACLYMWQACGRPVHAPPRTHYVDWQICALASHLNCTSKSRPAINHQEHDASSVQRERALKEGRLQFVYVFP